MNERRDGGRGVSELSRQEEEKGGNIAQVKRGEKVVSRKVLAGNGGGGGRSEQTTRRWYQGCGGHDSPEDLGRQGWLTPFGQLSNGNSPRAGRESA